MYIVLEEENMIKHSTVSFAALKCLYEQSQSLLKAPRGIDTKTSNLFFANAGNE